MALLSCTGFAHCDNQVVCLVIRDERIIGHLCHKHGNSVVEDEATRVLHFDGDNPTVLCLRHADHNEFVIDGQAVVKEIDLAAIPKDLYENPSDADHLIRSIRTKLRGLSPGSPARARITAVIDEIWMTAHPKAEEQ